VPGSAAGSTSGTGTESGEPKPCGRIGRTVWYRVVPASSGTLTASTAGSGFDTVLAVYRGTSLSGLTSLDCNDDSGGTSQSRVVASVTAGQTYYVQVGGHRNASGSYALSLTLGASASGVSSAENTEESPPGTRKAAPSSSDSDD